MAPFDAPEEDIAEPAGAPDPARLAWLVVARGAATGLIVAVPAAFANTVFAVETPKPRAALNITSLVVFLGFLLAGWLAGREAPGQIAKHGALAALVAFVPIEVIAVLGRLDRDAGVSLFSIIFLGLIAACLGTIGAMAGGRKRKGGSA